MYRMLIVDDDEMIRNGIKKAINWNSCNISHVMTASNGQEALNICQDYKPDIILTDIKMPNMDGLEFLEKVKKIKADTKVIILSAYDQFSYAQTALKLGAYDYQLKTIDLSFLTEVIKKAVHEVEKDIKKRIKNIKLKGLLNVSLPLLKDRYLNELVNKGPSRDLIEKLRMINISIEQNPYLIMILNIDNNSVETEAKRNSQNIQAKIKDEILSDVENLFKGNGICFINSEGKIVIIYTNLSLNADDSNLKMRNICRKIQEYINNYYDNITISIGLSNIFNDIQHINECYKEAQAAIEQKFFLGKGTVIFYSDLEYPDKEGSFDLCHNTERLLSSSLRTIDIDNVMDILENIFRQIEDSISMSVGTFREICIELINILSRTLKEFDLDIKEIFGEDFIYFDEVKKYQTFQDTKNWVIFVFEKCMKYLQSSKLMAKRRVIEIAKQYINENYHKNLTLNEIADLVYMSPNYFSSLFSSEIGMSFSEYLIYVRMEKAKQLIAMDDLKMYEVSERVGYNNPNYFSRIFKKYVGLSPQEYKQAVKSK